MVRLKSFLKHIDCSKTEFRFDQFCHDIHDLTKILPDPRSYQDIKDKIQDYGKIFKNSIFYKSMGDVITRCRVALGNDFKVNSQKEWRENFWKF